MNDAASRPSSFPWPPLIYVSAIAISIILWALYPKLLPWFGSPLSDILFAVGCVAVVTRCALGLSGLMVVLAALRVRTAET